MKQNAELYSLGIGSPWPSRKVLIKSLRDYSPAGPEEIINYNNRRDVENTLNVVERTAYSVIGNQLEGEAIASAFEQRTWLPILARSTSYRLFANRMGFFWNYNFRLLFPNHPSPLRGFNFENAIVTMGYAFLLGWKDEGVYQGYIVNASLNRGYNLALPYEERHRRGQAFMMRLFSDWRGDATHQWPPYAYDEPIYEGLLENWRNADPESLLPWLLAACDRHTHQAGRETSKKFYDFSDPALVRTPIEIFMVLRLRETLGLENPMIDHPLMEAPFDRLPEPQPTLEPDELMKETLARARQDWPSMDEALSLQSIR